MTQYRSPTTLGSSKHVGVTTRPGGTWVQTERAAHEEWAKLSISHPRASALLHVIISEMGRHNALLVSLPNLAKLSSMSRSTVIRALTVLRDQRWVEVVQIGQSGTVNAYVVNDRVAWSGKREGIRYSLFSAAVIASETEQPDGADIDHRPALHRIPALYPGERQLPSGDGMPPPAEPSLPGMEPDLPARKK